MQLPMIHLGGTSKLALVEQLCEAGNRVHAADEALANATPNARDYHKIGDDAFQTAMAEHDARRKKLRDVYEELCALNGIDAGGYQRQ